MPILHANLEPDLRLARQLDQALLVNLTDMAWIRNIPGMIDFHGEVNGTGSDTGSLRYWNGGGADPMASVGEDQDVAETPITTRSVDIAVTRAALVRNESWIATGTGFAQDIDPRTLAADMVNSYDAYFNQVFASTITGASSTVGTSGVDMSVDDFYDAIFTLELADNMGPFFCVLHPRQFADFQESLRGEGGAVQFSPRTQEMLEIAGQGVAGSFMGVTIMKSSFVESDGTDRQGAMYGAGALGYKVAIVGDRSLIGSSSSVVVRQDEVIISISTLDNRALTQITGNAYLGMALKEQARIVGINTDA